MPFVVPLADPSAAPIPGPALSGPNASVIASIRDASTRSGMSFDVMLASASLESGLNPSAQAGSSSATGLFQFIDQTWLDSVRQFGPQHGLGPESAMIQRRDGHYSVDDPAARQRILDLRKNPDIASVIAADHLRAISDKVGLVLGRPPDATEIYLGHLLGSGGASQILQAARTTPNQAASDLLPAAARSNPTLFNSPDGTPYTVPQFIEHLRGRVSRAYASIGAVMPVGPLNLAQSRPSTNAATPVKVAAGLRHAHQPLVRQAMANLTEVIAKLNLSAQGGGQSAVRHHGDSEAMLPASLMSTLRGSPEGKAA